MKKVKWRKGLWGRRGWRLHLKSVRRRRRFRRRHAGYQRFVENANRLQKKLGKTRKLGKTPFLHNKILAPKPEISNTLQFLSSVPDLFTVNEFKSKDDGHLQIPKIFSLIDNSVESFEFLKRLFVILLGQKSEKVILDYGKCERIDVDASICMDVILADFIKYFNRCKDRGHEVRTKFIVPKNFENPQIMRILFSIGAYRNIAQIEIKFPDIIALPVLIGNQDDTNRWGKCEIDATKIVEYIKKCIDRMHRTLSPDSEDSMYKVLGEIITNAEEHGTLKYRYAIGFFQEIEDSDDHFGIFNFSIFNFGETIYQKFKSPSCENKKVVDQMTDLSSLYTDKKWLRKAEFEEETLWTLYALQEGVTSKERKRGNGSIQFIENFFKLKGDMTKDNISSMVVVSGNTRIIFDGTYSIIKKPQGGVEKPFKMITFNESGEISEVPNKKFVTFAPHFFPGVLISARILIKFVNTSKENNEHSSL